MDAGLQDHALGSHLLEAAVDQPLLELEVGNAVAEQTADAIALLEDRDGVPGTGQLLRSMSLMLESAGISSTGLIGLLRTKALAAIYLATMRDWLRDDTTDKAKTMAALDGLFEFEPVGALTLKGFSQPVPGFALKR